MQLLSRKEKKTKGAHPVPEFEAFEEEKENWVFGSEDVTSKTYGELTGKLSAHYPRRVIVNWSFV